MSQAPVQRLQPRKIPILPTLFTLGNLVCGFFAVVIASRVAAPENSLGNLASDTDNCVFSAGLIFLAMVFDALDGYVARLSHSSSEFGAQLDSLCDVVSFGVAPAFLLVKMCPMIAHDYRQPLWTIAAAYAVCAALRLARFNSETSDDDDHMEFRGLPSPAAAASIAGFAIMFYTLRKTDGLLYPANRIDAALQIMLPLFAGLVALLMASRVPYPHVVNQVFRGNRTGRHLVAILVSFVLILVAWHYTVPLLCVTFVVYGPARYIWEKWVERRHQEDAMF